MGDPQVAIDWLNKGRARELTAIWTYMAQHYELEDGDVGKLADTVKEVAIQEMKHAEDFAERTLFLGGEPTSQPDAEIKKGMSIPEMLEADVALEQQAVTMYNSAARACEEAGDHTTAQIFIRILAEEEGHVDLFGTIGDHLAKHGDAYLATLLGGSADEG
ncbi:MAG: ferritin-like domain-containing protein [Phycisphaerae bacterium]